MAKKNISAFCNKWAAERCILRDLLIDDSSLHLGNLPS